MNKNNLKILLTFTLFLAIANNCFASSSMGCMFKRNTNTFSLDTLDNRCCSIVDFDSIFAKQAFQHVFKIKGANSGYGILENGDVLYIECWNSRGGGMNAKLLLNKPEKGILAGNEDFWRAKLLDLAKIILKEEDLLDFKNSLNELSLDEDKSNLSLIVSSKYTEFGAFAKDVNMETTVIIIYIDNY